MDAVDRMITRKLREDLQRELAKLSDIELREQLHEAKKAFLRSLNRAEVNVNQIFINELEREIVRRNKEKPDGKQTGNNKPGHN